jgi:hypothetical protein
MNTGPLKPAEPIRMVFELTRDDHPRLYDDLIRFQKGTKRINRLRVLAYDGLLMQSTHFLPDPCAAEQPDSASGAQTGRGDVTNDTFAPALDA